MNPADQSISQISPELVRPAFSSSLFLVSQRQQPPTESLSSQLLKTFAPTEFLLSSFAVSLCRTVVRFVERRSLCARLTYLHHLINRHPEIYIFFVISNFFSESFCTKYQLTASAHTRGDATLSPDCVHCTRVFSI